MLSIHDLLEDSQYKEFFCRVPALPPHVLYNPEAKPWRLYVKLHKDSRWHTKDYRTYKEAFVKLRSMLPKIADGAITCKVKDFPPPYRIVRIKGKYQTDKNGKFILDAQGKKKQITKMVYWKPQMPMDEFQEHTWCPYCRRPSIFDYFLSHHALPPRKLGGMPIDPSVLRCVICGASERIVNLRFTM